ncbi:MAG: hypothetical protein ACRC2K_13195 [Clostridium sp.]
MNIYEMKAGDIFKTSDDKFRMIVGGNTSYGRVTWLTVDPTTGEIKSRFCNSLADLLFGYKIVGIIRKENAVLEIGEMEIAEDARVEIVDDEESIPIEEVNRVTNDEYDIDSDYTCDDEDDEDDEYGDDDEDEREIDVF